MQLPNEYPPRWSTTLIVLAAAVVLGILVGAITNAVNGYVSPGYFRLVMGWNMEATGIWARAILQGMLEGGALGLAYGIFMGITIIASTRRRCPLSLALRYLVLAVAVVLICWTIGGCVGVWLSRQSQYPWWASWLVRGSVGSPRFAWVGGTIDGAYGGTAVGLLVTTVLLHLKWKRILREERRGFAVQTSSSHTS